MTDSSRKAQVWNRCVKEFGKYPTNKELERYLSGEISFEHIRDIHEEMQDSPERAKEIQSDRFTM